MSTTIVKHSEYNVEKLVFAPLTNPKKKTLQSILLPTYDGGRGPLIQLPEICLDMYGIPSKCDFYKEDYQRLFLKLPLNIKNKETKELTEGFLKQLDEKLNTTDFKENTLGGKKAKYTYQPIVRFPVLEDGTPDPNKHPYMKIKLLTEFPTNKIRTLIIEQTDENSRFLKTDTETLTDFEKYFPLRTNLKCMIVPIKIWVHPTSPNESTYGLAFKLIKVLVKLPLEKALAKHADEQDIDFLNSESE